MKIGTIKKVIYKYCQEKCFECGEPATHKITYLLDNARSNPQSSGYRKDDISWCSDDQCFACDEHKEKAIHNPPDGMGWGGDFNAGKEGELVEGNQHWICNWVKIGEELEEPN